MFLLVLVCPLVGAQLRQAKKVLLLEDQTSAPASLAIENELIPTLNAKSVDPIEYFRESLDTILIPDKKHQQEVREWYERKYARHQLDLIITSVQNPTNLCGALMKSFFKCTGRFASTRRLAVRRGRWDADDHDDDHRHWPTDS